MTTKHFCIAITFDPELDAFDPTTGNEQLGSWDGIEFGVPRIMRTLETLGNAIGKDIVSSWFVRCDDHIEDLTGSASFLLNKFKETWKSIRRDRGEICFHPHLYERSPNGNWIQSTNSTAISEQIYRSHYQMKLAGFDPAISRIGNAYGSNACFQALSELGIIADSSAMPGRLRVDQHRTIDWVNTPRKAYKPSRNDYRQPGTPAHDILQIPFSMIETKASYDNSVFLRYLDLSFHPDVFLNGFHDLVKSSDYAVTITHPSALLDSGKAHGLISYDLYSLGQNLKQLIEALNQIERPYKFVTMSELASQLNEVTR